MDNSLMKSNLKKIDFHSTTTPLRPPIQTTDFFSSQKQKYDQGQMSKASHMTTINNLSNIMFNTETYHNQKEIYDSQIPIKVKSFDREEYQTYLNLRISLMTPAHNQILHFELTDESNHLFLYIMDLSETDFLSLKQEQSILVDFQGFPPRLVEMLELCMTMSNNKEDKTTFGCQFEIKNNGEGYFNVIESNQFRVLPHMSLRFREATDQILKQYLAHRLTNEKAHNEELRNKNDRLEETVSLKTSDLEKASKDLRRVQEDTEKRIQSLLLDEQKKHHEEKLASLDKETKTAKDYEDEKKQLNLRYETTTRDLHAKVETLTQSVQDLQELRLNLESKERELTSRVRLLEKENALQQKDVEILRSDNKNLEKIRFEQEKSIAELSAKCHSYENQMGTKQEVTDKTKELLESANAQKAILEDNVAQLKKANEKLEQKCQMCTEEINKGNEIIEKLQNDISSQKQKLKLKNAVAVQQEQSLTQHQDDIAKLNKAINDLRRDNDNKDLKLKEEESVINDLKTKLQQAQERIDSSQNMVNFLNQKINENGNKSFMSRTGYNTGKYNTFNQGLLQGSSLNPSIDQEPYQTIGYGTKYSQYSTQYGQYNKNPLSSINSENTQQTLTSPLTYSKTMTGGFEGATTGHNEKSPIKTFDYERNSAMTTTFNKENFNATNRSSESNYAVGKYQNLTHDLTSTSSIDMSNYARGVQPIKYKDPSAK